MNRRGWLWVIAFVTALAGPVEARDYCDRFFCLRLVESNRAVDIVAVNRTRHALLSTRLFVKLKNASTNHKEPLIFSVEPGKTKKLLNIKAKPTGPWSYRVRHLWNYGRTGVTHDKMARYLLPARPGTSQKIGQGCSTRFSHSGARQYATDIVMKIGTPVHAARKGKVIAAKDDSDKGGRSRRKYEKLANYVIVEHDDGTLAAYLHLKKDGARVEPGETVRAGQHIADSGNTGWSTAPHLHFEVFKLNNDMKWQSQKIKFLADEGYVTCPKNQVLKAKEL